MYELTDAADVLKNKILSQNISWFRRLQCIGTNQM